MMKQLSSSLLLTGVLFISALSMVGCKTAVEVLSVTGPDSLRTNESGTFMANVNEKASLPIEYNWNFGDSRTGIGQSTTHSFGQPGTYTVTVTATNKKGPDSGETTVVVYRPPVPAEIVTISANPQNPNTRTPVAFTSNVRGDVPLTYSWSFGNMGSSTSANPTYTFDTPGTYTVSLTVSNADGSDTRSMTLTVGVFEAEYCSEVIEMNAAYFARNSSVLTPEALAALQENLQILNDCPNTSVRVEGYAAPGERNAQSLSEDRARAVEQFYASNGIAISRAMAVGKGLVSGTTSKKEGIEQYRRVDTIPVR
jgi:outer membrane protein OmpA-like peptidoglycan-associated protein